MRAGGDLQFAPVPPQPVKPPPEWLRSFDRWLVNVFKPLARGLDWIVETIFKPLAQALHVSWPVMKWLLIAAAVIALALLGWRLVVWLRAKFPARKPATAAEWAPDRAEAAALLEDADRLAAQGRYDEAAHLLLRRSCNQIQGAHPDWLHPASTAREIAAMTRLPEQARTAFAVIADRVEASRYALRALIEADWHAARAAYAQFALRGPEPA
jgi:hypothetical protein